MILMKWILGIIAFLAGLALYFSRQTMYPKIRRPEVVMDMETSRDPSLETFFVEALKTCVSIETDDHVILDSWWYEVEKPIGIMIVVHGIRMNKYASLKYIRLFRDMGYHVLAIDLRNHGETESKFDQFTSYGVFEQLDVKAAVDWAILKSNGLYPIFTHGESMGASTVLLHAANDHRISGVIADCGFESAERIFKEILWREHHIPSWPILYIASVFNYIKTGVYFKEMNPLVKLDDIQCPVLLIHGDADDYVVLDHAHNLAQKLRKLGKVHHLEIVEGAGHAKAIVVNSDQYEKVCRNFLNQIVD